MKTTSMFFSKIWKFWQKVVKFLLIWYIIHVKKSRIQIQTFEWKIKNHDNDILIGHYSQNEKIQNPDLDPGLKNPGFIQTWINSEKSSLDPDPGFKKIQNLESRSRIFKDGSLTWSNFLILSDGNLVPAVPIGATCEKFLKVDKFYAFSRQLEKIFKRQLT